MRAGQGLGRPEIQHKALHPILPSALQVLNASCFLILLRNQESLHSGGIGVPLILSCFLYLVTLEYHLPLQPTLSPGKSQWFLCTYPSASSDTLPFTFRVSPVFISRLKISNFS